MIDIFIYILYIPLTLQILAEDFQLPRCGGKYFPDHSQVQAKEHRNVMQILPHVLNGLDEELTELACR